MVGREGTYWKLGEVGSGPHYLVIFFCTALGRAVCFSDLSFLFCKTRVLGPHVPGGLHFGCHLSSSLSAPALHLPWISLWNFSTKRVLYLCILPISSKKTSQIKWNARKIQAARRQSRGTRGSSTATNHQAQLVLAPKCF